MDTLYYVRGFSEDNNNTDADSSPSNEVSYRRPQLKTNGTNNTFEIINSAGQTGTNIDVMEEVFLHVTPDTTTITIDTMKEFYIDWGDGGVATQEWWAMELQGNPPAGTTTLSFASTAGLKKGDYIVLSENLTKAITAFADAGGGQVTVTSASHTLPEGSTVVITGTTNYNGTFTATNVTTNTFEITDTWVADDGTGDWASWQVVARKIDSMTATVLTLDSAISQDFTSDAIAIKTRKHVYTETGAKAALCQLTNEQGFQSKLRAVNTSPDPQAIDPVAVIEPEKVTLDAGETINISGLPSKERNMDKSIVWGTELGPYTHDGGDGSGFAKDTGEDFVADGALIGYMVYNQTDKCHGIITSFTGVNQINFSGGLDGGTDDDFDDGDTFIILASGWVPVDTTDATIGDQAAAGTTVSFAAAGNKTLKLNITDDTTKSDQTTKTFTVVAETFILYHSGWVVNYTTADAAGKTVKVNGTTFTEDVDFDAGATNSATADNIRDAINSAALGNIRAFSAAEVVCVVGSVVSVEGTATFLPEQSRSLFSTNIGRAPNRRVEVRDILGATGHVKKILSLGSDLYEVAGDIGDVGSKNALEGLNAGTSDFMIAWADKSTGSLRKLYPLSMGIRVIERNDDLIPTNQGTDTTTGIWRFSGTFVDGGEYSG